MQTKNEIGFLQGNCPELGAVLKELRQPYVSSWAMTFASLVGGLSLFLLMCGGELTRAHHHTISEQDFPVIGLSFAGLGLLFWGWVCLTRERSLRFHENGVSLLQAGKETKIPYSQLEQFAFKKTKLYLSGGKQCFSTRFDLEFNSDSTHSIKWSHTSCPYSLNHADHGRNFPDYDWLNHHLSRIVADNIAEQIKKGHKIPWGPSAFISKAGLEIEKKTGMLSSELIFVPWSDLTDLQFRDGQLSFEIGKPQSSQSWNATINSDETNVLPGYLAVKQLLKSQASSPAIRYQSEVDISSAIAGESRTFVRWYE